MSAQLETSCAPRTDRCLLLQGGSKELLQKPLKLYFLKMDKLATLGEIWLVKQPLVFNGRRRDITRSDGGGGIMQKGRNHEKTSLI